MSVKRLPFSTEIQAPLTVVRDVMPGKDTDPMGPRTSAEGSYFEDSWEEETRMHSRIPSGDAMVAEIAEHRAGEFRCVRHLGFIFGREKDTDCKAVRAWAPAYENYTLRQVPGGTELTLDRDVAAEFEASMRRAWSKALVMLRRLGEGRAQGSAGGDTGRRRRSMGVPVHTLRERPTPAAGRRRGDACRS